MLPRVALEPLMHPVGEKADTRQRGNGQHQREQQHRQFARAPVARGHAHRLAQQICDAKPALTARRRCDVYPALDVALNRACSAIGRAGRTARRSAPYASPCRENRPARRATRRGNAQPASIRKRPSAAGTAPARTARAACRRTRRHPRRSRSRQFDTGSGDRLISARVPAFARCAVPASVPPASAATVSSAGSAWPSAPAASTAPAGMRIKV